MSTPTYPLSTLAAQITASGISAPDLDEIIQSEIATYQGIYGSDTVLTDDTQDYQLIAVRSAAINDCNNLAIAIYNCYSVITAQGVALDAIAADLGIQREQATNSTVELELEGQAGTEIPGGIVEDINGNLWNLPENTTIPDSGTITVTATAQLPGALAIPANSTWNIYTIIPGWQSISNPEASEPGSGVETDAAFRVRILQSVTLPAQSMLSSIMAAVANTGGIDRYMPYENDTPAVDANGAPPHCVYIVVEGGNAQDIAQAIEQKKAPGTGTWGTTQVQVTDPSGVPILISFFELTEVPIYVALTLQPLAGYVSSTGQAVVAALAAFLSALSIGQTVYQSQLLGVASLIGNPLANTFIVTALTLGTSPDELSTNPVAIAFNAAAQGNTDNITLTTL